MRVLARHSVRSGVRTSDQPADGYQELICFCRELGRRPGPPLSSGGGAGAGRVLGQDAELVALGIGERDPAAAIGSPVISQA